jgi:hypothetical protein
MVTGTYPVEVQTRGDMLTESLRDESFGTHAHISVIGRWFAVVLMKNDILH